MSNDYTFSLNVHVTPETAFKAVTEQIDKWWTTEANKAVEIDEQLRVEFGGDTFKVMTVLESTPYKSLLWLVNEAHIGHETLNNKDEWVNTTIRWDFTKTEAGTRIDLMHQGLTTELECWNICSAGWEYFLGSLKFFLNTGKGSPFTNNG